MQTKVYPQLNSGTAVQVSETRVRLSGFSGTLAAETVSLDIDNNLTRRRTEVDATNRLETITTTVPGSSVSAVDTVRNGLLVSRSSTTVAAATVYGYDALGRMTSAKDPRHTHASSYVYHSTTGQLSSQSDAATEP